jgi:hypothetical protein
MVIASPSRMTSMVVGPGPTAARASIASCHSVIS